MTRDEMRDVVIYADQYWRLTPAGVVVCARPGEPERLVPPSAVPLPVARALRPAVAA